MTRLLDIAKVAEILGVDTKTLRRWDDERKLKAIRTLGNHRRYREEDINTLINGEMQSRKSDVFVYCRVSTRKQQESGNLQRQKERLVLVLKYMEQEVEEK